MSDVEELQNPELTRDQLHDQYCKLKRSDLLSKLTTLAWNHQILNNAVASMQTSQNHKVTHLLGEISQQKLQYEKKLYAKDQVIQQLRHLADARYCNALVLSDAVAAMRRCLEIIADPINYSNDGTCQGDFPALHAKTVLECISVKACEPNTEGNVK